MKREFPFGWALVLALVVHTLLGIVLKRNPLLIAAPAMRSAAAPLQMRFVESPPAAKVAPANPNATRLSDANRKAGPLIQTEKRQPKSTEYLKSRPKSDTTASAEKSASRSEAAVLPPIENAPVQQLPERGDYKIPSSNTDQKKLAESLKNLDQFIGSGTGDSAQGDVPSGDPGSGVFFDTQGFDLGPWANRVVAIVRSNWIVPVAAQLGVKGVVAVSFQVEKSGKIVNPRVISESGTPSFDQAALNALKTSSPLPPLPSEFPRPILPGVFRFYYNMPVPDK